MAQNAPIRRIFMSQVPAGFASVKLPAALVKQARDAAQPMRRSVAGQVEYWATLGRIVEHSGLTAQEAQTAIANYETAARSASPSSGEPANQADALLAQFMAVENDGSLAQRVREVVASARSAK
jgi:ParD-like antitoxin of type II bacterial toxin-antitoxin system